MQTVQVVLFVVVAALAMTLLGHILLPRLSRRRAEARHPAPPPVPPPEARAATPSAPLICPACRREYQSGLKYCPHDARALVVAAEAGARSSGSSSGGMTCPVCKRSFEGNKKFCPYDAEELVPVALAMRGARPPAALPRILGKICPHCAQRYESDATFCGRDGSELVSVN
jgi:predicted amidophosphoribosyltransferase